MSACLEAAAVAPHLQSPLGCRLPTVCAPRLRTEAGSCRGRGFGSARRLDAVSSLALHPDGGVSLESVAYCQARLIVPMKRTYAIANGLEPGGVGRVPCTGRSLCRQLPEPEVR